VSSSRDRHDERSLSTRPAVAFYATLAESGELLQIANVALRTASAENDGTEADAQTPRRERTFADLFPGADIGAVTAARRSATFPWVTPTSCLETSRSSTAPCVAGRLTRVELELRQEAPLSWHLSAREREENQAGWRAEAVRREVRKLCAELGATCPAS
jgi:hypothetical protein